VIRGLPIDRDAGEFGVFDRHFSLQQLERPPEFFLSGALRYFVFRKLER
jgi:hypothetical protein